MYLIPLHHRTTYIACIHVVWPCVCANQTSALRYPHPVNLCPGKFVPHSKPPHRCQCRTTLGLTNTTTPTTVTAAAAMSLRRALAPRSIHIRIVPRPANLSESREIYRVLQKFGELDTFKYLRVRPSRPILPAPGTMSCSAKKPHLTPTSTNIKTPQTMLLLPSTATKGPLSAPSTPRPSASHWKKSSRPSLSTHHNPLPRKKTKKMAAT